MTKAADLSKTGSLVNSSGQIDLTTGVTGVLPVANGGTGQSNGSLTLSGNLAFSGTGNRITGDFSNATHANRVLVQTSTTNGNTIVGFIPNGTATTSQLNVYNNSDPTNTSVGQFSAQSSTDIRLASNIAGTGSYLPLTMYTGGSERLRIDTSGNVGVGTSSPAFKLDVQGVVARVGGSTAGSNVAYVQYGSDSTDLNNYIAGVENGSFAWYQGEYGGTYTERLRIGTSGQLGIGGANYGTSGQVLTSAGSGSAPTWSDVSVTTAAVLAATAGASLGAVGAYSWLWTTTTGAVTAGSTIAGSNLRYAGFQTGASGDNNNSDNSLSGNGGTPSGTWRVMGRGAQTNYSVFLALRIS